LAGERKDNVGNDVLHVVDKITYQLPTGKGEDGISISGLRYGKRSHTLYMQVKEKTASALIFSRYGTRSRTPYMQAKEKTASALMFSRYQTRSHTSCSWVKEKTASASVFSRHQTRSHTSCRRATYRQSISIDVQRVSNKITYFL
jgi:hypothetical protein